MVYNVHYSTQILRHVPFVLIKYRLKFIREICMLLCALKALEFSCIYNKV